MLTNYSVRPTYQPTIVPATNYSPSDTTFIQSNVSIISYVQFN